jgi:hypothetical protein
MTQFANNQEFYSCIDATCLQLRTIGLDAEANKISYLLHNLAWTTTSELFLELESVLQKVLTGPSARLLPQSLRDEITTYLNAIDHALLK